MSVSSGCLPPTSSLPPVRSIRAEKQIISGLQNLRQLYCPLRVPVKSLTNKRLQLATFSPADSGYTSQNEEDDEEESHTEDFDALARLRADAFERDHTVRWLTSLIGRADELPFDSEETRSTIIDEAAFILASFTDSGDDDVEEALTRDFSFPTALTSSVPTNIKVRLNDAPLSTTDHTDVGLQSWGASIILSELMCASPERFGLDNLKLRSPIVELGAGTGLVSLTIATLLPHVSTAIPTVVATDYHSAVLENLRTNITTNFGSQDPPPVHTMLLDWSAPSLESPLDVPIKFVVAADVVYAPQHATWLRDCAAQLLALDGTFWLIVTVREVGKFEGIADTVEAAFASEDCPKKEGRVLQILEKERLDKKRGIGRGDEVGYNLYRIGWTS